MPVNLPVHVTTGWIRESLRELMSNWVWAVNSKYAVLSSFGCTTSKASTDFCSPSRKTDSEVWVTRDSIVDPKSNLMMTPSMDRATLTTASKRRRFEETYVTL